VRFHNEVWGGQTVKARFAAFPRWAMILPTVLVVLVVGLGSWTAGCTGDETVERPAGTSASASKETSVPLTDEERSWLREHPTIRVAQDPGWPPVEFADEDGRPAGMSEDYLRLVERRLGITFERVIGLSWQEAYEKLRRWDIDMTTCVAFTAERGEFWAFTEPYLDIPIVIAAHSDVTYVNDMRELVGKRIAVVDGYVAAEWLARDYPDLELVKVASVQAGLDLVERGEVFAFVDNMLVIGYQMAQSQLVDLKIAGETPYANAQAMAVRKDWTILAGIVQKALDTISETERNEIYQRWVPIRYERGFDYRLLWQMLVVFVLIVAVLALWNRRLWGEIKRRRTAETALGDSEQRFRTLFDVASFPLCYVDKNGALADFNRRFVETFGYTHEDVPTLAEWWRLAYPDPEYRRWVVETWDAAVRNAAENDTDIEPIEYEVTCKDGRVLTMLISGTTLGEGLLGTFFDVTDRKRAEAAVLEEKAFSDTLLDAPQDTVFVFDPATGRPIRWNRYFVQVSGYSDSEITRMKAPDDFFGKDDLERARAAMARVVAEGRGVVELSLITKAKMRIPFEYAGSLVTTPEDRTLLLVIGRDVTERKATERALEARQRELERLYEFASGLAAARSGVEIFEYIARKLKEITGGVSATFGLYDPLKQSVQVKYMDIDKNVVSDLARVLGGSRLADTAFPIGEEQYRRLLDSPVGYMPSLSEATFGVVPKFASDAVQRLQGVDRFLGIGYILEGELYGTSVVALRPADPDPSPELVKSFAEMVAVSLRRVRAEAATRESNERFALAFQTSPWAMTITRAADGKFIDVNDAFTTMTGYTREEALAGTSVDMNLWVDGVDRDRVLTALSAGQPVMGEEFLFRRKDGTIMTGFFSARTIQLGQSMCVLSSINDITLRKLAEADRDRLTTAIEQAGEAIIITDIEGTIEYVNPAFERVTGYSPEEVRGQNPRVLKSGEHPDSYYRELWQTISSGQTWEGRIVNKRKDGTLYTEEATISPVFDAAGRIVNYVAVKRDITEQLRVAAQFQQALKMESVGRLAGGVAHDYNNMLSVIVGYAELAQGRTSPDEPLYADLDEIVKAAKRSAEITKQLLTFARKQAIAPHVLDLNKTVEGMLKMLARLIGEDIDLVWRPGSGVWPVRMDPAQIDQILANLCVNARDAISDVGRVVIETENVILDETYTGEGVGPVSGEYVLLSVRDDGSGMDEETLSQVFEPFFTTKGVGRGTGLGLGTVYGIVKQNEGLIDVESELGRGTRFKIYLPRHVGEAEESAPGTVADSPPSRGETILIVEDEAAILKLAVRILVEMGYQVISAGTPGQALEVAAEHAKGGPLGVIDLLLTDVIMPEMNGRELAERLRATYPDLRTLFMSGYTADVIVNRGVLDEGVHFIQKPFSMLEMAAKVREALDGM